MSSLLLARPARAASAPTPGRPLVLIATLGGALAALAPLLVLVAVGVVGWFVSDAGVHGAPRDGMRAGALAWLAAHGSGISVAGARVTLVPLAVTAVCAWSTWRLGTRVGDAVSGHGPDADRISDGERDWTVPSAVLLFFVGYAVVGVVVGTLAATAGTAPSTARVVGWSLLLSLAVAAPAIATASGRAAIWATFTPPALRSGAVVCRSVLVAFLGVSALVVLGSLAVDLGEAATMVAQLHTSPGEATLYSLVNAAFVPNAALFAGSYLLGPGFAVGGATLVSPGLVVLGPLPVFPLLAALPAAGPTPGWVVALVAVPPVVAALATARVLRRRPTLRWDEAALAGCGGGIAAGVLLTVLAAVAGGAAGPGRMQHVGPHVFDLLVHAITAFGVGGLVGALAVTWWQRRHAPTAA